MCARSSRCRARSTASSSPRSIRRARRPTRASGPATSSRRWIARRPLRSRRSAWRCRRSRGRSLSAGLKFAGYPWLGARATEPGPDALAVIVGQASHLLVSAIWGAIFGIVAFGARRALTVLYGALYGIVVWLGMYYVVLPIVGLGATRGQMPV